MRSQVVLGTRDSAGSVTMDSLMMDVEQHNYLNTLGTLRIVLPTVGLRTGPALMWRLLMLPDKTD